ncbi:MAG: DNA repair protein RecN [bacterium]
MLRELFIRNLAIIEQARIELGPGFSVLTGETGAGKSLLVGALELALGERARAEWICAGAEEAQVEAAFETDQIPGVRGLLQEAGYPLEDLLVIRRSITRAGKSRIHVNDRPSTVTFLESLGQRLVDIHGQHEHQSLLRIQRHRELVDQFGGLLALQQQVAELVRRLCAARKALAEREEENRRSLAERDLAELQLREIARAQLRPGEEEELEQERRKLVHAGRLQEACVESEAALYSGADSVADRLGRVRKRMQEAVQVDPQLSSVADLLDTAIPCLEEASQNLRQYLSSLDGDPLRLDQIEERLSLLYQLKRKYRASIDEMLALAEDLRARVQRLEEFEGERKALAEGIRSLEGALLKAAGNLSAERKKTARAMEAEVKRELRAIGMKEVDFHVDFRPLSAEATTGGEEQLRLQGERLSPHGLDQIEFVIRTNPGQPFKPLQRIASGGELSRLMLALRNALHRFDPLPTLVFDEVDAGIGGAEAEAVGSRLKALSRHFQILCITHLPQIAVFADRHFKVSKQTARDRTSFHIQPLDQKEREEEIARMLGGIQMTRKTYAHAREMLERGASVEPVPTGSISEAVQKCPDARRTKMGTHPKDGVSDPWEDKS